jgi:hypothetical protein
MVLFLNSFITISLLILFSACSSKPHYIPEKSKYEDKILPFLFSKVTLQKIGNSEIKLSDGRVINRNGEEIDDLRKELGEIAENWVSISKKENLIAFVDIENRVSLFDHLKKQTIFSSKFATASSIDGRLPNPVFDGENILYFTLDGKIAVFSISENQIVRVIKVGEAENYSNVVDFHLSKNSITLLTHKELLLIKDDFSEKLEFNIRGAIFESDETFILIKKDGELVRYNENLEPLEKIKFPFAYFIAFGKVEDKIYLVESAGYVIELKSDFSDYRVLPSELDDEKCFFAKDRFICDEKELPVPLSI